MSYTLGLDLGSTWTIAAVNNGTSNTVFSFPSGESAIPSVVAIDESASYLFGESAARHAESNPSAVAREFRRRFGDNTPLLLSGSPVSAAELTLGLVSHVVETVSSQIGERPDAIVVTHPASWGEYKAGLLSDTLEAGSLPSQTLIPSPLAVASHLGAAGATAAVYDLGGTTLEISIVGPDTDGWQLIGRPGGIERLGGIDFDTALFQHVTEVAGIDLDRWDADDPATRLSVGGLRDACNSAKHRLSSERETTIAVSLPGVETTVDVSRQTFELLIEPLIATSLDSFDQMLQANGLTVQSLDQIIVTGGSGRIPLIGEQLASHTARPVVLADTGRAAPALGAASIRPAVMLGTNFPAVPDMTAEPPPDFLHRTIAVDSALPKPEAAVQQAAPPAIQVTQPLPAVAPVATPSVPFTPPKRRKGPFVAALVVLAMAALGALAVQANRNVTEPAATTVTELPTPTTPSSTTITTIVLAENECSVDLQPKADAAYRVKPLPADDPDGGLVGRAEPRLDGDRVTVFESLSPVKVTGSDCAIDEDGRVWWGAGWQGDFVWVSATFLEEI